MGWMTAIGSFLGLVNNNQTASEIASDISSGIDKMWYTEEERSEDAIATTKAASEVWLKMLEMTKSAEALRSVTRRILALGIVGNIFMLIWLCVVVELLQAFALITLPVISAEGLSFTNVTWTVLKISGIFQLGWAFCTIIIFYYGPHLIQHFKSNRK